MDKNAVLGTILRAGLVPVLVDDRLPAMRCVEALLDAGVGAMEVSLRHPRVLDVVREVKREAPDFAVGGASLLEEGRYLDWVRAAGRPLPGIAEAVDAGADFLVSLLPFREATYARYSSSHVIIPGVATPGEAHRALDWGANLVKFINPHLSGGPAFFRGMDAATHRGFPFFTTGGIRPDVIPGYVEAHVLVFACGFEVILGDDCDAMARRWDAGLVRDALAAYTGAIREARQRCEPGVPFESGDAAAIARASGRCLNVDIA
jgi:2-dehydro-3-deoxyphosphogluconate aldolase/(4S)-4-hydroxy-2-oxoglutarate aldolase